MLQVITVVAARLGYVDVEAPQSAMSVTGEIKVTVWPECRKFLVSRCVDRVSQVLYPSCRTSCKAYPPDVETAFPAGHVTCEVKPVSVWRYRRMGETRQGVTADFQLCCLSPCCIRTVADGYLGVTWVAGVGQTLRDVHLPAICGEGRCSLIRLCIQSGHNDFRCAPFPLFVFLT